MHRGFKSKDIERWRAEGNMLKNQHDWDDSVNFLKKMTRRRHVGERLGRRFNLSEKWRKVKIPLISTTVSSGIGVGVGIFLNLPDKVFVSEVTALTAMGVTVGCILGIAASFNRGSQDVV